jgi:anti-sigma-K factor RskA
MNCEELRDEYAAYALGSSDDPERSEISAHLARNCADCMSGVRAAMAAAAAMAGAVKGVDPPGSLRRRIIALVKPEAERSWAAVLIPWGVAAALAIAVVMTVRNGSNPRPDPKLTQALSILNDPDTKDVSFGDPAARGRVFVSSGKGVVFIAAHLPSLEAGKTFELWVIPQAGNPIPAGTFIGEKDSTAMYVRPGPVENAAAMAVTVEPVGGSAQPTTKPFIVTKL